MIELVENWLIKTVVIMLLNWVGWLHLLENGKHVSGFTTETFVVALIVAAIFAIVAYAAVLLTLGLALLLYVFLGGLVLHMTAVVAPEYLSTNGFWLTMLCGFIIMAAGLRHS